MKQSLDIPIIFQRVRIDGMHASREIDMILDTGAIYTAISWDIAKDIGYDPAIAQNRVPIITANGVIEVPKIKVEAIGFRELYVEDVEVICHDIPEIAEIEGLLGLTFLKHFKVLLDFKNSIIEIV
jgi:clan AA aspartic protease (TIGR02281 family)